MGDTGLPCTEPANRNPFPEERLWAMVIRQGLKDATGKIPMEREMARLWFRSSEFTTVCQLAGLEPDYVGRLVQVAARVGMKSGKKASSPWQADGQTCKQPLQVRGGVMRESA